EDSCLSLHDLAQRPEGDPFAVWEAAPLAPVDDVGLVVEPLAELPQEARLADTGLPDQRDELHRLVAAHASVRLLARRDLGMTAARASRPSSLVASRTFRPTRTARSASSSWATGAPKTAMTASPTYFSTTPPSRSISSRTRAWYGLSVAWTSSGSAASDSAVNPTRSTKMTETTLR